MTATTRSFPAGFLWGAATASYQIEGGAAEGGRTPSIWDTFSHTPGLVQGGDTGDVACDHFHRWEQDLDMMKELGLTAYRFSISWSRVQPHGSGPLNPEGVEFYRRILAGLRERGITSYVTLYHWDLPQELEDAGGWPVRETAYAYERYVRLIVPELGDLVDQWTTLNEPWCSSYLGYGSGAHAPGRGEPEAALKAVHHLNLAHGLGAKAIHEILGDDAKVSITLNQHAFYPDTDTPANRDAVRQVDALANRAFLEPMLRGVYPADLLADTAHIVDWEALVHDGDLELIRQPINILGINYYNSALVRRHVGDGPMVQEDGHKVTAHSPWIGADDVEFPATPGLHTAMGWNIDPAAFTAMLIDLHQRYPEFPISITENGAAFDDDVTYEAGVERVHDPLRIQYLHDHVEAMGQAMDAGVDIRGYFAWSLMDNFEWAYGFSKRFGIVRVDYPTGERAWKDSAFWYRQLATTNQLPAVTDVPA